MNFLEKYQTIESIHRRIKYKSTGTPDNLATKINKSRSALYKYLEELKAMGALINYNRTKQTFEYQNNFEINLNVKFEE